MVTVAESAANWRNTHTHVDRYMQTFGIYNYAFYKATNGQTDSYFFYKETAKTSELNIWKRCALVSPISSDIKEKFTHFRRLLWKIHVSVCCFLKGITDLCRMSHIVRFSFLNIQCSYLTSYTCALIFFFFFSFLFYWMLAVWQRERCFRIVVPAVLRVNLVMFPFFHQASDQTS